MTEGDHQPYFNVALNLPHAGRIARRIERLLPDPTSDLGAEAHEAQRVTGELVDLLDPCLDADENPAPAVSTRIQGRAAALGRKLVDHIERGGLGHDRLGQCVRNFFECLELGREGAEISLRAGENPRSMQRPV
jgi:hypothetical protein